MSILSNEDHRHQDSIGGLSGSPKTMFVLGLSVGVGSMAVLALIFMVTVLMNGTEGVFAAKQAGDTDPTAVAVADPTADTTATETADPLPVPDVTSADHVRGNENAIVTLIEYSDFECPYCGTHIDTLEQLLADYPNDVRIVYRHFPLSFHEFSGLAAEASECASYQGKFWEMHDEFFELAASEGLSEEGINAIASEIGLDMEAYESCLQNGDGYEKVATDYNSGIDSGVSGTPGTFVNGMLVEGAVPYETFQQLVESAGASS